jgi:hypothetical protein
VQAMPMIPVDNSERSSWHIALGLKQLLSAVIAKIVTQVLTPEEQKQVSPCYCFSAVELHLLSCLCHGC